MDLSEEACNFQALLKEKRNRNCKIHIVIFQSISKMLNVVGYGRNSSEELRIIIPLYIKRRKQGTLKGTVCLRSKQGMSGARCQTQVHEQTGNKALQVSHTLSFSPPTQ